MSLKISLDSLCKSCYFLVNTKKAITISMAFKIHFTSEPPPRNEYYWTSITTGNTKFCFCNLNFLLGHLELKISFLNHTHVIKYVFNNNTLYICIYDKLLSLLELCYFQTLSSTSIKVNNINLINFEYRQVLLRIVIGNFLFIQTESCRCIYKKEFTLLSNFMINNYVTPYYKIHKYNLPILQHTLQEELYKILYIHYQRRNKNCFKFSNVELYISLIHAKKLANISQEYINPDWNYIDCLIENRNIYLLSNNNKKWYLNHKPL